MKRRGPERREKEMNARGEREVILLLSLPLSCWEAVEEGTNLPPLLAHSCHLLRILKVTPFLFTNTRLFTKSNHLSRTVAHRSVFTSVTQEVGSIADMLLVSWQSVLILYTALRTCS